MPIVFALPLVRRHRRGGGRGRRGKLWCERDRPRDLSRSHSRSRSCPHHRPCPPPSSAADRPRSPRVRAPHPPQRPAWSSPPVVVIGVIVVRRLVSVDTSSTSRVSLLSLAPQAVRQPPSWSTEGESIALITHRDRGIARKRNGL